MPRLTRRDLEWTIQEAMKSKAPNMFRELKESGELEEVVQMRAVDIEENYAEMTNDILNHLSRMEFKDPLERVQRLTMENNTAWGIALNMGLEFTDMERDEEEEEDVDESLILEMLGLYGAENEGGMENVREMEVPRRG